MDIFLNLVYCSVHGMMQPLKFLNSLKDLVKLMTTKILVARTGVATNTAVVCVCWLTNIFTVINTQLLL